MKRSRRRRGWLRAASVLATIGLTSTVGHPSAHGEEVEVTVDLVQSVDPSGDVQVAPATFSTTGRLVDLEAGRNLGDGCLELAEESICLGSSITPTGIDVIRSDGLPAADAAARSAFGWIVDEAVVALSAAYDVPADERLRQFAAGDVRAYAVARVLAILDKAAFGEDLTVDEQTTLRYVEERQLEGDRRLTRYALEEHQLWQEQGCGYEPPATPAYVADPVPMPEDVRTWCLRARSTLETALTFAPPMPSTEHFQTWAMYRHVEDLGLDVLEHADFQRSLAATVTGWTGLAGTVGAVGLGAIVAGIVGYVTPVTVALGFSLGVLNTAWAWEIPMAVQIANLTSNIAPQLAATAFGAASIVVFFLVLIALSVWQFANTFSVGNNLAEQHRLAMAATDPFGLAALRAANTGTTLAEGRAAWEADPASAPAYRQPAAIATLQQLVTRATTVSPTGTVVPDTIGVWDDAGTGADDFGFRVTTDGHTHDTSEITVPGVDGGTATVRFDRSWMIVTPHYADGHDGPSFATLRFDYVDHEGDHALAARAPGGGWILSRESDESTVAGQASPILASRDVDGDLMTVQIVPPAGPPTPAGLRPAVAGPLLPGRVHNLRPNPVDQNGNFNLDTFLDDHDYEWSVARLDAETGSWDDVDGLTPVAQGGNAGYGARFTPDVPGRHRAVVTMTDRGDGTIHTGQVEFTVAAPPIRVPELTLVDDPVTDTLRVDLQLAEDVPGDDLTVDVQWPASIGSADAGPTSHAELACHPDLVTCSTVRTTNDPALREALTVTLPSRADLREDVIVTARNRHGVTVERRLAIDQDARPRFTAPSPPAPDQPGLVRFDADQTVVQLPVSVPDADPNHEIARIVPGDGHDDSTSFLLIDPATGGPATANSIVPLPGTIVSVVERDSGDWAVTLRGLARPDQIGTYNVPIVVRQDSGARATMLLRLEVVPAVDDRYRGALLSDVDPEDFGVEALPALVPIVLGGRPEWGAYEGDLCVSLQGEFGPTGERCAEVATYYDADDQPRPFAYHDLAPHGLDVGVHRARAWLPDGEGRESEPVEVSFALSSGAPTVESLTWDDGADRFAIDLAPFRADQGGGDPVAIASITCALDDGPPEACFEVEGGAWAPTWSPGALDAGSHEVHLVATDVTGNYDTRSLGFEVGHGDQTAPVVAITTPADGAVFTVGQHVVAHYACLDEEGGSGVTACEGSVAAGSALDTTTVGDFTFTVNTGDAAGNTAEVRRHYSVVRPRCQGREATVVLALGEAPTAGPDVVVGTSGPDVIDGRGGDDVICGLAGDDDLRGGPGHDRIHGGAGRDVVRAGRGGGLLTGHTGADRLVGGSGRDVLRGGPGTDTLIGRRGADRGNGGPQRDRCVLAPGRDTAVSCERR